MVIASSFPNPEVMRSALSNFSLSSIPEGSPLRTMSLLWCGRNQDIFNGDHILDRWREHIGSLIANKVNTKSAYGVLGDKLWSQQRQVEAAHFCYLLAEHDFDSFDNPHSRLVLLGGDHKTRRSSFINTETIRSTEVMEYAKSLSNPQYTMSQFQAYKFVYMLYLADLGLMDTAKKYHTAIENSISRNRSSHNYNPLFLAYMEEFKQRSNFATKTGGFEF